MTNVKEIIGKTYVNHFANFINFAPKAHNFTKLSKLQLKYFNYGNTNQGHEVSR